MNPAVFCSGTGLRAHVSNITKCDCREVQRVRHALCWTYAFLSLHSLNKLQTSWLYLISHSIMTDIPADLLERLRKLSSTASEDSLYERKRTTPVRLLHLLYLIKSQSNLIHVRLEGQINPRAYEDVSFPQFIGIPILLYC
jgi:hypothetical protein